MTQVKASTAKAAVTETKNGAIIPAVNITNEVKEESLDLRLARIYDLHETATKLETYRETLKDLKTFKTGKSNLNLSLTLTDGDKNFRTNNPEAVATIIGSLTVFIETKIAETTSQLFL